MQLSGHNHKINSDSVIRTQGLLWDDNNLLVVHYLTYYYMQRLIRVWLYYTFMTHEERRGGVYRKAELIYWIISQYWPCIILLITLLLSKWINTWTWILDECIAVIFGKGGDLVLCIDCWLDAEMWAWLSGAEFNDFPRTVLNSQKYACLLCHYSFIHVPFYCGQCYYWHQQHSHTWILGIQTRRF